MSAKTQSTKMYSHQVQAYLSGFMPYFWFHQCKHVTGRGIQEENTAMWKQ